MTQTQIETTASAGESELVEFKKTTGELRSGCLTLCAMLNHRGGKVLFGIDPAGKVLGQDVTEKTLEDVAQEIKMIDPPVFPTVDRVPLENGKTVIVVAVQHGHGRPYSYKNQAYRRVGNTSPPMTRDEYNRMLLERLHGESRWENEVAHDWNTADLDQAEITRTVEEALRRGRLDDPGTRDPNELLRGMGLLRNGAILRAAAVLFGRESIVEARLPQCLLRVARFKGIDKTEFHDNRQFHGNAFQLLTQAEKFLRENLPVASRIVSDSMVRNDTPRYPPVALREALANAFCHRDYSIGGGSVAVAIYDDRLEITSSGSLHFGLTPAKLYEPHESLPWNPLIARVFYRRGVIEQWGRGTLKIAELMAQAGLKAPEITDGGGCVTLCFRPPRFIPPRRVPHDLTERQRTILAHLDSGSSLSRSELVHYFGTDATERQLKEDLAILKRLGLIILQGRGPGSRWSLRQISPQID